MRFSRPNHYELCDISPAGVRFGGACPAISLVRHWEVTARVHKDFLSGFSSDLFNFFYLFYLFWELDQQRTGGDWRNLACAELAGVCKKYKLRN
jgi:hypothetical protein